MVEVRDKLGSQLLARPNFKQPPFDKVETRRAAMMAINQKEVLEAYVGDPDFFKVCGAVLGCNSALGSQSGADTLVAGGDKAKARKMLSDAG